MYIVHCRVGERGPEWDRGQDGAGARMRQVAGWDSVQDGTPQVILYRDQSFSLFTVYVKGFWNNEESI